MRASVSSLSGRRRHGGRRFLVGALVAALVAADAFTATAHAATPAPPTGWRQVFADDFTGAANSGLNTADWLYDIGTSYPGGAPNWGTGEVETATNSTENVYQDGHGHLVIKPIRSASGAWTSGRVETQRTDFAAPPGGKVRIEGSLQQPNVTGAAAAGYWPAFWAMGEGARGTGATNWPSIGEWDIMEAVNGRSSVFTTLHCGTSSGGPCNETFGLAGGERPCPGCQTSFHTYAVEHDRSVSPEQLRWYLDGVQIHSVSAGHMDATTWNDATNHGMFIILNVAIGGFFPAAFGGGPTAATQSGVPMLVDYVAVYTQGGGGTTPPYSSPSPDGGGSRSAYSQIEAESFNAQSGATTEACSEGGQNIGAVRNGDWVQFNGVDFGTSGVRDFVARVASGAVRGVSGLVEVRVDSRTNAPIGAFAVADTGGWQSWWSVPANVADVSGVHTVFMTFTSGQPNAFVNVDWLTFRR